MTVADDYRINANRCFEDASKQVGGSCPLAFTGGELVIACAGI